VYLYLHLHSVCVCVCVVYVNLEVRILGIHSACAVCVHAVCVFTLCVCALALVCARTFILKSTALPAHTHTDTHPSNVHGHVCVRTPPAHTLTHTHPSNVHNTHDYRRMHFCIVESISTWQNAFLHCRVYFSTL